MATQITGAALVAAGKALLAYVRAGNTVPYAKAGMTLKGMDCQGLVEYCLIQAGVPKGECGLSGSNAHWRACTWRGTPEACKAAFGDVPEGAALFIVSSDNGEPAKYRGDGYGNASHIGLWLGDASIAASQSKGQVVESNFRGRSISGGWNRIGLLPWVDYGLRETEPGAAEDTGGDAAPQEVAPQAAPTYAAVTTPDGNPVRAREQPKRDAVWKFAIPSGTRVRLLGESGNYCKVYWLGKGRWVQKDFLQALKGEEAV